jgi:hypothetical protein
LLKAGRWLLSKEVHAPGDWAFGDREAAVLAVEPLAKELKKSVKDVCLEILEVSSLKLVPVIERLIKEYMEIQENYRDCVCIRDLSTEHKRKIN